MRFAGRWARRAGVVTFGEGAKMYLHPGATTVMQNYICGLRDYSEMAFLLHVLRPGDLFLDVGANVGSYSVLAGYCAGADVVAVEPIPATVDRLVENVALNGLQDRVTIVRKGVADKNGSLNFTTGLDTINHVAVDKARAAEAMPIEVTTLDTICGNRVPVLLKMDVEGYEVPALRGAAGILKDEQLRAIIIEANDTGRRYGFDEARGADILERAGFVACAYDPEKRDIVGCSSDGGGENVLYVRDPAWVRDRVRNARHFAVANARL